jgi:hypothetical protein
MEDLAMFYGASPEILRVPESSIEFNGDRKITLGKGLWS